MSFRSSLANGTPFLFIGVICSLCAAVVIGLAAAWLAGQAAGFLAGAVVVGLFLAISWRLASQAQIRLEKGNRQ